jgi:hypothetical protein
MPQVVHRISIFVAASSGVAQERDALKEVVAKLDDRYDRWGIDLQVINWQSNVIPDFGIDPQDVINRQVRFGWHRHLPWNCLGTNRNSHTARDLWNSGRGEPCPSVVSTNGPSVAHHVLLVRSHHFATICRCLPGAAGYEVQAVDRELCAVQALP